MSTKSEKEKKFAQKTKEAKKDHLLDIDHEYQHIIDGIDKKQKDINKSLLGR